MCQVLFHDLFGCESCIEEEPLHARLSTLNLWELCTSSYNLSGKIPEDFSAARSRGVPVPELHMTGVQNNWALLIQGFAVIFGTLQKVKDSEDEQSICCCT